MARLLAGALLVVAVVAGVGLFARPHAGGSAHAAAFCGGVNRWEVKTLSDLHGATLPPLNPDATPPPVLKPDAEVRTIRYLVTRMHDKIGTQRPRLVGVERTKYVLKEVTLVEAKVEDDQDLHLVIKGQRDSARVPQHRLQRQCPTDVQGLDQKGARRRGRAPAALPYWVRQRLGSAARNGDDPWRRLLRSPARH
jgi:hypothetical protein